MEWFERMSKAISYLEDSLEGNLDISLAGEMGKLGVCMEFNQEQEEFTYLIGVEKPIGPLPEGMVEKDIPAETWAVFEAVGPMPDAIQ